MLAPRTSARAWRSPSTRSGPTSCARRSPSSASSSASTTVMAMASMVQGIRTPDLQRDRGRRARRRSTSSASSPRRRSIPTACPTRSGSGRSLQRERRRGDRAGCRRSRYAGIWVQVFQRIEYQGSGTQQVTVFGADEHYMEIQGGTLLRGPVLQPGGAHRRARSSCSRATWPIASSAGSIRWASRSGSAGGRSGSSAIFEKPSNIFEPPGQETGGVIPFADRAARASTTTRPTASSSR